MIIKRKIHTLVLICISLCAAKTVYANNASPSVNYLGMVGLNTVPTARLDDTGTIRAGLSTQDPYNHAFIGFQIAKPLYINLRQSMGVSSVTKNPDFVYPGMDIKLRIANETQYNPDIVLGLNSMMGHKRFSSEYIALSKRYYDFDFTGGVAWGRLGSAGHLKNPFGRLSNHFKNNRDFNNEDSSTPSNWFTGEDIGFFGGIEYRTPIDNLSLKADFNADSYKGETILSDFKAPSPWSFGFNYAPKDWVSFGASIIGTDKVMARLSFQGNSFNWNTAGYKKTKSDEFHRVSKDQLKIEGTTVTGFLHLNDYEPSSMQIGRAAKSLVKLSDSNIKTIVVVPMSKGLKGQAMTFSRWNLEQEVYDTQPISPEEIWKDLEFSQKTGIDFSKETPRKYKLLPELSFSLTEEETTHLYRASVLGEETKNWGYGIFTGNSARINIADNLGRIAKFRDINANPIRSDIDLFTLNPINIDRSFLSFLNTPITDFHMAGTLGYLEEMYAGYGGEILYRPSHSAFAIGGEWWNVYKRDPLTYLSSGLYDGPYKTGHLNLYYNIPDTNITAFSKIGRFIAGDVGVSTGAQMLLENGMKVKGSLSYTNYNDKDIFDSDRNIQAGLELSIPFGDMKFIPQGSEARINTGQLGRNDAAMINKPIDLYDVTEPMSYRHLGQNWQEVLN